MKLMKYTFKTPLFGSINCEELLSDTDGRIELSPEQMCILYNQGEKLLMFLTENSEDLAKYVPEEMEGIILRAEFGDCAMFNDRMYLHTHIWVKEPLTETGIETIQEWITGQMSDGWGEGLEQREWWRKRVEKPVMYFDEDSCDFEQDTEYCHVEYFVNPWSYDGYSIEVEDIEEVEEDLSFTVVATMSLSHHQREVIKLNSGFALKSFLKDFNHEEFADEINRACPTPKCSIYLVRDIDAPSGIEILPKWVYEYGCEYVLFDHTVEKDYTTTFNTTLSKAILELMA